DPRHPSLPDGDRVRRMFALPIAGHDPRHRRKGSVPRVPEVGTSRLDVRDLVVPPYRLEAGERVPDARGRSRLRSTAAHHLPIGAVRLAAVRNEVTPAHVSAVQEIREIRPGVRSRPGRALSAWDGA